MPTFASPRSSHSGKREGGERVVGRMGDIGVENGKGRVVRRTA